MSFTSKSMPPPPPSNQPRSLATKVEKRKEGKSGPLFTLISPLKSDRKLPKFFSNLSIFQCGTKRSTLKIRKLF